MAHQVSAGLEPVGGFKILTLIIWKLQSVTFRSSQIYSRHLLNTSEAHSHNLLLWAHGMSRLHNRTVTLFRIVLLGRSKRKFSSVFYEPPILLQIWVERLGVDLRLVPVQVESMTMQGVQHSISNLTGEIPSWSDKTLVWQSRVVSWSNHQSCTFAVLGSRRRSQRDKRPTIILGISP